MATRHMHISVGLDFLEGLLRERQQQGKTQSALVDSEGTPMPYAAAYRAIADLRDLGLRFITPDCDNVQPDGSCGGHEGPAPS